MILDLRNILAGHVTDRAPEVVQGSPSISIHELYYQLATLTTGSHVGIYNDANNGNVYRNTLKEFLQ